MAIFDWQSRILGRNSGHSSVQYAAYLSAEKIYDEKYGEVRSFTRKAQQERVYEKEIIAPATAPEWVRDRGTLWNKVEAVEKRKDSQLCREIHVALPKELTHEQKMDLVRRYVREEFVSKGMVADVAYHNFRGKNSHNPHAHILLTTREIEKGEFASKKAEAWRPKIVKDKSGHHSVDPDQIAEERRAWERYCNHSLEQAGHSSRVDSRSLKERGIDRLPQPKLGKAKHMEERPEWAGRTDAGAVWREVQEINQQKAILASLEQEQQHLSSAIEQEKLQVAIELGHQLARDELERKDRRRRDREEKERQNTAQKREETERRRDVAPSLTPEEMRYLQQIKDGERERNEPCLDGSSSNQGEKPKQGTQEQQIARLKEEMAAFEPKEKEPPPPEPPRERGRSR